MSIRLGRKGDRGPVIGPETRHQKEPKRTIKNHPGSLAGSLRILAAPTTRIEDGRDPWSVNVLSQEKPEYHQVGTDFGLVMFCLVWGRNNSPGCLSCCRRTSTFMSSNFKLSTYTSCSCCLFVSTSSTCYWEQVVPQQFTGRYRFRSNKTGSINYDEFITNLLLTMILIKGTTQVSTIPPRSG